MKIVSLVILLSYCWLLGMPIMAAPLKGAVLCNSNANAPLDQSANIQNSQTAGNNYDLYADINKLCPPAPSRFKLKTIVNLNTKPSQFQANHGEAPVGVMGCAFDPIAGTFRTVYPGSDLLRFGIHPGDSYLTVRGQPIVHNERWFQDMTRGKPGTYVTVTVLHDGMPTDIKVMRKDSRLFVQYYSGDNYFRWCAAQTKYW